MKLFSIYFHELIWKEDFKNIDKKDQKLLFKQIIKKLSVDPISFGKPLSGNLKGLFSLRIGEFRVIYKVKKKEIEVLVVKIGFRRNMEVYIKTLKRI